MLFLPPGPRGHGTRNWDLLCRGDKQLWRGADWQRVHVCRRTVDHRGWRHHDLDGSWTPGCLLQGTAFARHCECKPLTSRRNYGQIRKEVELVF